MVVVEWNGVILQQMGSTFPQMLNLQSDSVKEARVLCRRWQDPQHWLV